MTRPRPEPVRDHRWVCPCGCALVLSTTDSAMERRLLENLGEFTMVSYRSRPPSPVAPRPEPVDPIEPVFCPGCGGTFEVEPYLAAFVRGNRGVPARCERCRSGEHKPNLRLVP